MSLMKIKDLFHFEKGVLQSSKCIPGEFDFITASSEWKSHNEYTHDCEALIFAAAASGSLGRTHYVNGKFISSDLCFIITPKDQKKYPIDLKFYHLIFQTLKDEIVRNTKAGTSKEAIGLTVFGNYELPYFDIAKQIETKEKFVQAQKPTIGLSTELTHQLALVKQLRQSFLREAMQGKLTADFRSAHPELIEGENSAQALLEKIKVNRNGSLDRSIKKEKELPPIKEEEMPFEIPENWVWCRLGEVTNYGSSSKAEPADLKDDTWVLDLEDVEKESSKLIEKIRFKERNSLSTKSRFNVGDVLYSKLRPYLDKVIVADEVGVCTTEILPLKCFAEMNPFFLRYSLKREDFLLYVNSVTKGMKMPRLGTKEGELALIPLPPLSEQQAIVTKLDELMRYCDELEASIRTSQQQNEMLLQQVLREALNG